MNFYFQYQQTHPKLVIPFTKLMLWLKPAKHRFLKENPSMRFIVNAIKHADHIGWTPQFKQLDEAVAKWMTKEENVNAEDENSIEGHFTFSYKTILLIHLLGDDDDVLCFPSFFVLNELKEGQYMARPAGTGIALAYPIIATNIDESTLSARVNSSTVDFTLACETREPLLDGEGNQVVGLLYGEDDAMANFFIHMDSVFKGGSYLKDFFPDKIAFINNTPDFDPANHYDSTKELYDLLDKWYKKKFSVDMPKTFFMPALQAAMRWAKEGEDSKEDELLLLPRHFDYDAETRFITVSKDYSESLGDDLLLKITEYVGEVKNIRQVTVKREKRIVLGEELGLYYLRIAVTVKPIQELE